jgi:DNA-binding response OmpR family regulator
MRGSPAEEYSVLILDASEEHAASLLDALQDAGIKATAFQAKQKFLEHVARQSINLAILVLHSKSWWKDELRLFCNSIRYLQETPELVCVLTWPPEGPQDRLYGEALGVGVLHVG